jgi:hypothetical protein
MNRGTTWSAILPGAWQLSEKDSPGVSGRWLDYLPRDPAQGNLDPALPTGVGLAGKFSNVDVDEAASRWPLHHRAEKVRQAIVPIIFHHHRAVEAQDFPLGPLNLNGFVLAALADLKPEVNAGWRRNQDDT